MMTSLRVFKPNVRSRGGFTMVELLTVIAIIAILAGLTLAAASGVMNSALRNRTKSEIEAIKTALEAYKVDNGAYPVGNTTATSGSKLLGPPATTYFSSYPDPAVAQQGSYQNASEALYLALTGQANYSVAPAAGVKSYITFRTNQVGSVGSGASMLTYVKDPWNNPYGYSNGDNLNPQVQYPNNGPGNFDIWSTAGTTGLKPATDPNTWITNWQSQ